MRDLPRGQHHMCLEGGTARYVMRAPTFGTHWRPTATVGGARPEAAPTGPAPSPATEDAEGAPAAHAAHADAAHADAAGRAQHGGRALLTRITSPPRPRPAARAVGLWMPARPPRPARPPPPLGKGGRLPPGAAAIRPPPGLLQLSPEAAGVLGGTAGAFPHVGQMLGQAAMAVVWLALAA